MDDNGLSTTYKLNYRAVRSGHYTFPVAAPFHIS